MLRASWRHGDVEPAHGRRNALVASHGPARAGRASARANRATLRGLYVLGGFGASAAGFGAAGFAGGGGFGGADSSHHTVKSA